MGLGHKVLCEFPDVLGSSDQANLSVSPSSPAEPTPLMEMEQQESASCSINSIVNGGQVQTLLLEIMYEPEATLTFDSQIPGGGVAGLGVRKSSFSI